MARIFRSSRPDGWSSPRFHSDETFREIAQGKILPMEEPGFLARLFGRRRRFSQGIKKGRRVRALRPFFCSRGYSLPYQYSSGSSGVSAW